MSKPTFPGFDYQTTKPLVLPKREWLTKFDLVLSAGGHKKRIAGDQTAFDANGRMLFEMYEDKAQGVQS